MTMWQKEWDKEGDGGAATRGKCYFKTRKKKELQPSG